MSTPVKDELHGRYWPDDPQQWEVAYREVQAAVSNLACKQAEEHIAEYDELADGDLDATIDELIDRVREYAHELFVEGSPAQRLYDDWFYQGAPFMLAQAVANGVSLYLSAAGRTDITFGQVLRSALGAIAGAPSRYSDSDLQRRLLENLGDSVQIVTYRGPEGTTANVALENLDTGSVIFDFDVNQTHTEEST